MMRRVRRRAQPRRPSPTRPSVARRVDALRGARLACRQPKQHAADGEIGLRLIVLERIARPIPRLAEILGGLRGHHLANALVSFLFACTGPVALILTVGIAGGLKPAEIASWISIAFGLGGVITFAMSYLYRQPLAMAWTIPGTAIVGAGLLKFPYPEIVGAYVVAGARLDWRVQEDHGLDAAAHCDGDGSGPVPQIRCARDRRLRQGADRGGGRDGRVCAVLPAAPAWPFRAAGGGGACGGCRCDWR